MSHHQQEQDFLNPYEAVASVDSPVDTIVPDGRLEWEGHRFTITAKQIPRSLWLVGRIDVRIDDAEAMRFIKWRWNKQAVWTFTHQDKQIPAKLYCSGAYQIHCRLMIEEVQGGESIVSAERFWIGLLTVALITGAMTIVIATTFAA